MTNRELTTRSRPAQITTDIRQPDIQLPAYPAPPVLPPAEEKSPLFFVLLRKRWWVLGLIFVISGVLSYFLATEFRTLNSQVTGSMIYNGLPTPPGPAVYQPPSLPTYKEVLFSPDSMQTIAVRHGLDIPPDRLADLFEVKVVGRSSVMELKLGWPDAENGVAILNDTMQTLIDEAAKGRTKILREHMKHVGLIDLQASADVDEASQELNAARLGHETELRSNGLATERYSSVLKKVTDTQSAIDMKDIAISGLKQQIARAEEQRVAQLSLYQTEVVKKRQLQLELIMKEYNETSSRYQELTKVKQELDQVDTTGKTVSLLEWETTIGAIGLTTLGPLSQVLVNELLALKSSVGQADSRLGDLRFELASLENHMALLKERMKDYQNEATHEASDVAIASLARVAECEKNLEAAEMRSKLIKQQLENMQQLEQCPSREFSVLVPASAETAVVTSNAKKLFVMSFFACSLLLVCPVAVTEWFLQRDSAVATFARRWHMPLITDRVIPKFKTHDRTAAARDCDEAIRMAALRIQQSLHQSSNVVLFSGLGESSAPAGILMSLSECLANRGERVLLVDAVDRRKHDSSSTAVSELAEHATPEPDAKMADSDSTTAAADKCAKGLVDIFSGEAPNIGELIQHTRHPCVDVIGSGEGLFPVEAMASESLTELLMDCQHSYSMIFVAGPPIASRADFQMLAARADAIVLTADNRSVAHPISHTAVRDLIELQAPIIGMLA